MTDQGRPLANQVALVAGATRGAGRGIARALAEAGALVCCTGRSAAGRPKGMDRPETIEETATLIREAGGQAVAVRVDHTRDEGVTALAVSPGFLRSEAVLQHFGVTEETWRDAIAKDPYFIESETPMLTGRAVAALAADPKVKRKAGLIHFASDLAREYGFTDVDGRTPDFPAKLDGEVAAMAAAPDPPMDDHSRFLMWARYCQIHQDPARRALAEALSRALGLEGLGPGLSPAAARL